MPSKTIDEPYNSTVANYTSLTIAPNIPGDYNSLPLAETYTDPILVHEKSLSVREALRQDLVTNDTLSSYFTGLTEQQISHLLNHLREKYANIAFNSINYVVTLLAGYAEQQFEEIFEELDNNLLSAVSEKMIASINGTDSYQLESKTASAPEGDLTEWYIGSKVEDLEDMLGRTLESNQVPDWQQDTNQQNLENIKKLKSLRSHGYKGKFFEFSPAPHGREKDGYIADAVFTYELKQRNDGTTYEDVQQYWIPKTADKVWEHLADEITPNQSVDTQTTTQTSQILAREDVIKLSGAFNEQQEARIIEFIKRQRENIKKEDLQEIVRYKNTTIQEEVYKKLIPSVKAAAVIFVETNKIPKEQLSTILDGISALQLQLKYKIHETIFPTQKKPNSLTAKQFSQLTDQQKIAHMQQVKHSYLGCNGSSSYGGSNDVYGSSGGIIGASSGEFFSNDPYQYFLGKYPDYIHLCKEGPCVRDGCINYELLGPCQQCMDCDKDPTNQ